MRTRLDLIMPTISSDYCAKVYENEKYGNGKFESNYRFDNNNKLERIESDKILLPHDVSPVVYNAPRRYKKAVETIARYFRREFQYDFTQYCHLERCPNTVAYLWHRDNLGINSDTNVVFGACCFRYRDEKWGIKENPYCATVDMATSF